MKFPGHGVDHIASNTDIPWNQGMVFDKERIYEKVCGYDAEGDSRVVTELVHRIRKKFQEQTETEYIETVWGMGYRWKK